MYLKRELIVVEESAIHGSPHGIVQNHFVFYPPACGQWSTRVLFKMTG